MRARRAFIGARGVQLVLRHGHARMRAFGILYQRVQRLRVIARGAHVRIGLRHGERAVGIEAHVDGERALFAFERGVRLDPVDHRLSVRGLRLQLVADGGDAALHARVRGTDNALGQILDLPVGIEIDLPISDPLWKRGLIAKAHAQVEVQQEILYGAQQQVAQDVWTAYTALQAATESLSSSEALLESARRSFQTSQNRYEGGAGDILELLNAQGAYANAQQQRIQSLSDWRIARLALGATLGQLDMPAIQNAP